MRGTDPDLGFHIAAGQGHAPVLETGGMPDIIADFLARADKG